MELTKEAIIELQKSTYDRKFVEKMIRNNGEAYDTTYVGEYRGFHLFDSDTEEESFALNSKYFDEEGFNIYSYDGIDDLKGYIDDAIDDNGFEVSADEKIKDDSIIIESIKVEANEWFDKTYGNTYHQARAIINNEYIVAQDKFSYGGQNHYETTILKDLQKAGVLKTGDYTSLWKYCDENGIEYKSSSIDGLKRDLPFKDNDAYTQAEGLQFKTKSNEVFDDLVKAIEFNFKDESNISKALRVCVEAELCDVKIPSLINRVNTLYGTALTYNTTSLNETSDNKALQEVVKAVKEKDSMFDFSKELTLSRIHKECLNIYQDKLSTLKSLNVVGNVGFLEKKIDNLQEKISKLDTKESDSSKEENKQKPKKQR